MKLSCFKVSDANWCELLQEQPHDFYHLPAYVALEAKRLQGQAEAIYIEAGEQRFFLPYILRSCSPVLPESIGDSDPMDIISPYGYPSLLLSQAGAQSQDFLKAALQQAVEFWRDRNICSAFLRLHPLLAPALDSLDPDTTNPFGVTANGRTVAIDLNQSTEELDAQLFKKHRYNVRKAIKEGFEVRWGTVEDDLSELIAVYQATMERVGASSSYYFDEAYFRNFAEAMGDRLNLCIVEQDGVMACSSLVIETCGIVQDHLGGSRAEMMKYSPSTLMTVAMRDWAKARGNRWLHLGGGLGGSTEDALFKYKSRFSPLSFPFYTMRLVIDPSQYEKLTDERGKLLQVDSRSLKQSDFFPCYRANATSQSPEKPAIDTPAEPAKI